MTIAAIVTRAVDVVFAVGTTIGVTAIMAAVVIRLVRRCWHYAFEAVK